MAEQKTYQLVFQFTNGIVQVDLKWELFTIPKRPKARKKMVATRLEQEMKVFDFSQIIWLAVIKRRVRPQALKW